ncbi:UNVERIFIED_ORG: hypothetical protein B2H95_05675 [Clostridium botulinum]|uniref:hypothetical protein n=1 Tax=Clostridium sp. ZBS15 TaxID=2949969 RepID=UPI000A175D67|nr:hypothetical protein [Clostridium sp. ZBS15]
MNVTHKVLFYINKNIINLYTIRDNKFEVMLKGGEEEILFDNEFWNWFKSAISYSKETDLIDYCIITDNSVNILPCDFNVVKKSSWKEYEIKKFYDENIINSNVIIKDKLGNVIFSLKKTIQLFEKHQNIEYEIISIGNIFKKQEEKTKNQILNNGLRNYYLEKISTK